MGCLQARTDVFDKTPVVERNFLVNADVPSWLERFIVKSDDRLLEIAKGDGDQAQQLLYDNWHDWPSGELKLPWIHVWLKGRRGRSMLATAVYLL